MRAPQPHAISVDTKDTTIAMFARAFTRTAKNLVRNMSSSSRPSKLTGAALTAQLNNVPNWKKVEGRDAIQRTFQFSDFKEAFAFMTSTALCAETVRRLHQLLCSSSVPSSHMFDACIVGALWGRAYKPVSPSLQLDPIILSDSLTITYPQTTV